MEDKPKKSGKQEDNNQKRRKENSQTNQKRIRTKRQKRRQQNDLTVSILSHVYFCGRTKRAPARRTRISRPDTGSLSQTAQTREDCQPIAALIYVWIPGSWRNPVCDVTVCSTLGGARLPAQVNVEEEEKKNGARREAAIET